MTQTERFYNYIRWFKDAQNEIEAEYSRSMEYADRFKGSEGYKELKAKADETRAAALKKEKESTGKAFREIFAAMRANVANRKTTLPTPEQAALLTILKTRTTLTRDDIKEAANSLKDCPAALAALHDIAKEHQLTVHIDTGTLPASYISEHIDSLERSAFAMLSGEGVITNRKPESEGECLTRWGSFGYALDNVGGNLVNKGRINEPLIANFSAAVNGEGAEA